MPRRRPRYSGTHPRRFDERYKEHALADHPELALHLREKGRTPAGTHLPIMVDEVIAALAPKAGETFVDCTLGFGGHARALLERLTAGGGAGRLVALDVDGRELPRTIERLAPFGAALRPHRMPFSGLGKALALEGIVQVDGLLADLGVSSMQLDDGSRGFSVKHDGPLDLRMDDRLRTSGADAIASWSRERLVATLEELADEPDAAAIADAIVAERARRRIERTSDLVALVFRAKRITREQWRRRAEGAGRLVHPAARTFQALRMAVNDELGHLNALLRLAPALLAPRGRIAILSFHRGEEERVAAAFAAGVRDGVYASASGEAQRPSPDERRANPRSSSARLRFAIRAATA